MFTWTEQVALIILQKLNDPELVIYFMNILKPMRLSNLSEEAREFHESLRLSPEDRWSRTSKLKNLGQYHLMSPCVPVTFPLPYDGKMWRNHKRVSKMVTFMRSGYIRKVEDQTSKNAPVKTKVELVNLLYGEELESNVFRSMFSITDADEALKDFISIDEGDSNILSLDELVPSWEELPYLTAREHYNDGHHKTFKYMSIVN
jgi:hypothetical protein